MLDHLRHWHATNPTMTSLHHPIQLSPLKQVQEAHVEPTELAQHQVSHLGLAPLPLPLLHRIGTAGPSDGKKKRRWLLWSLLLGALLAVIALAVGLGVQ
jgi:hypothetical protein